MKYILTSFAIFSSLYSNAATTSICLGNLTDSVSTITFKDKNITQLYPHLLIKGKELKLSQNEKYTVPLLKDGVEGFENLGPGNEFSFSTKEGKDFRIKIEILDLREIDPTSKPSLIAFIDNGTSEYDVSTIASPDNKLDLSSLDRTTKNQDFYFTLTPGDCK